jgi:hypothetical protein
MVRCTRTSDTITCLLHIFIGISVMYLACPSARADDCGTPAQCYVKAAAMLNQATAKIADLQNQITNLTATGATLPVGTILAWFTKNGPVPNNWAICDGNNNTPDLHGKYLQGVVDFRDVSAGPPPIGAETHHHTFSASGDTGNSFGRGNAYHAEGGNPPQASGLDHTHAFSVSGNTNEESNIPPSIRVVYIMKVK